MSRTTLSGLLVFLLAPLVAASPELPQVDLAVSMLDHRYVDGVHPAVVEVAGACLPEAPGVEVVSCDDVGGSGRVWFPYVGLNAQHSVEQVPADVPVVQTSSSDGPQQLQVVEVELHHEGSLEVLIDPEPVPGLVLGPVASSASPSGASVEGQTVAWRVSSAEPGVYRFEVSYGMVSGADAPDSLLPRVRVMFEREDSALLQTIDGPAGNGRAVRRSQITFEQRSGPWVDFPTIDRMATRAAHPINRQSWSWASNVRLDGSGEHYAPRDGQVRKTFIVGAHEVLPVGASPSSGQRSLLVTTAGKAELVGPGSAEVGLATALPTSRNPIPVPIYPYDSIQLAAAGSVLDESTDDDREPTPGGTLLFAWSGEWARSWSATIANFAPHAEPNATSSPSTTLGMPHPLPTPPEAFHHLLSSTVLPAVVEEGDLDTREATDPIVGEPVTVTGPPGHDLQSVTWSYRTRGSRLFEVRADSQHDDTGLQLEGVSFTPMLLPDGVWLETSIDGYDLDWAAGLYVTTVTTPADHHHAAPMPLTFIDVEQGETVTVGSMDRTGRATSTTLRQPGSYVVSHVNGQLQVRHATRF